MEGVRYFILMIPTVFKQAIMDDTVEDDRKKGPTSGDEVIKGEVSESNDPSSSSGIRNSPDKEKYVRAKHKCPFPTCKSSVYHLPRHMRLTHGWSKEDALNVLGKFGLRKERPRKKSKKPEKSYMCPISKCQAVVKRIHNHLVEVHKVTGRIKRC